MRLAPVTLLLGCAAPPRDAGGDSAPAARADSHARLVQDSINRASPGYVIDSILPIEEELRRFRMGLPPAPAALHGGTDSRESLARAFVLALAARDTAALRRLVLTRAEFAFLVYPASPYTKPPYRQAPGLVWMQIATASSAGYARLVDRLGGRPLSFQALTCRSVPESQERNRIWRECRVRVTDARGAAGTLRLFGDIIERDGAFKFVSYANDM